MPQDPQIDFEWDPIKAEKSLRKHGISFEEGATVFLDPLAMTLADEDHSLEEERWITQGVSAQGRLLVVVHTFAEIDADRAVVRMFSCRRATRTERRRYEESP